MLFHMKDQKAAVLENDLNKLQKDGPAVWASLPEDELFTPAGFSEEQAEATAYSNYSYWGSTFRAFFKNRMAVALLIALVAVVAFAFVQPHLPGQVDPNLCEVDPATGIQYRNIAPGQQGFIWGSNAIGQDLWARIWAGARTSLTIAFFVAMIEAVVGITVGVLWGYVRQLDFFFTELYNICDNIPSTIILILISYVASPSIQTLILGMSLTGWIAMARFIRNQILIIRDRDYTALILPITVFATSSVMNDIYLNLPHRAAQPAALSGVGHHAAHGADHPRRHWQRGVHHLHRSGPLGGDALAGQPHQRRPQGHDAGGPAVSAALPHHHPELCHHRVLPHRQRLLGRCRPEEPHAVRRDRRWKRIS